jgi:hypothetical protein
MSDKPMATKRKPKPIKVGDRVKVSLLGEVRHITKNGRYFVYLETAYAEVGCQRDELRPRACCICKKRVDADENYCHGCHHIVCLKCVRLYGHERGGQHEIPIRRGKR